MPFRLRVPFGPASCRRLSCPAAEAEPEAAQVDVLAARAAMRPLQWRLALVNPIRWLRRPVDTSHQALGRTRLGDAASRREPEWAGGRARSRVAPPGAG